LSLSIKNSSIQFYLPFSGNAKLQIYNMKGLLVSTLIDSYKQAGSHTLKLDENKLCSGVYYYKLSSRNATLVNKIVMIK